jgi:hypothetical protein
MVLRDRTRFVVGSVGLGIALSGLMIFLGQMYRAIHTGHLESIPIRTILNEPIVRTRIPTTVLDWLQRVGAAFEVDGLVGWLVDEFPLALLLIVVGGVAAWRSLLSEPPASHRR